MNLIKIDNENSYKIEIYRQLRENAFTQDNSFIADSEKVVNVLLSTDLEVKSILATQEYYDKYKEIVISKGVDKLYLIEKEKMQDIIGHKIHHNCMMHGIRPDNLSLESLSNNIIMLDRITSTENVGSIARSAAAIGVSSLIVSKESPHPYSRRSLRVSMGHVSKLGMHIYSDIALTISMLKSYGYRVFGAEVTEKSTKLMDVKSSDKWVLLMGHEGMGLSKEVIDMCDEILEIEMVDGVRSFNVATAASIIMYQLKYKR